MLTGEPPWEEPKMEDPNFRHISAGGNLMQILTERRAGLSLDAMDLLQSMLWVDPADRLSLEQVMSHPWFSFLDKITIC
jgi:serine/threonine protein kinase